MTVRAGPVIGVVGGSGGVGASSFAAALACASAPALLIDLDVGGGGLDVLLGLEGTPGARWSGLQLAGGALDARVLRAGVCAWGSCGVLAADLPRVASEAVVQVLGVAAQAGPVVVDLPRTDCAERVAAVGSCDLVVVVARADVAGMVAAHGVVASVAAAPVGVLVRPGEVPPVEAARLVGGDFLGELPVRRRFDPARPGRASLRVAEGVIEGALDRIAA